MNKTRFKSILSYLLCTVLIAAMALFAFGCNDNQNASEDTGIEKSYTFIVKDAEGKETVFERKSSLKYLGDALLAEQLIEGEDGQYGLYVKKVNGILADFDVNQAYWKLIVDGKESMVGVSAVEITEGGVYRYEYTK